MSGFESEPWLGEGKRPAVPDHRSPSSTRGIIFRPYHSWAIAIYIVFEILER